MNRRRLNDFFDFNGFEDLFNEMEDFFSRVQTSKHPMTYEVNIKFAPETNSPKESSNESSTLVDVINEKEKVRLLLEIPGVRRITATLNGKFVTVRSKGKIIKKVGVPVAHYKGMTSTLKNGILEIILKK